MVGTVQGTSGDDLITAAYLGDPDGDRVDNADAVLPGAAPQDDLIVALEGNDTVLAGEGNDIVYGGLDDDRLYGEAGDDSLFGGKGQDILWGGEGDDLLEGDAGDDILKGGDGDDVIYGGVGNDTILGDGGSDTLFGGDDRDIFIVDHPQGGLGDTIYGGDGGDDFDTLDLRGSGPFRIVGVTTDSDGNGIDGTIEFLDEDENVTGTTIFENIEEIIPCFTPGTTIATPKGERLVEELREGDRIITRDNGIQEIRWVGRKDISGRELVNTPYLKPVLIKAGALGNGLPERDMLVSPNHRLLVANDRTQLYFDESEVLAAAKHLVGSAGIVELDVMQTSYIHFMFDRHEVVLSNGAWTESFQPGDYSLKGIGNSQRGEILELFPELASQTGLDGYQAARKSLKKHEARLLVK